jgi:hypothetical protein
MLPSPYPPLVSTLPHISSRDEGLGIENWIWGLREGILGFENRGEKGHNFWNFRERGLEIGDVRDRGMGLGAGDKGIFQVGSSRVARGPRSALVGAPAPLGRDKTLAKTLVAKWLARVAWPAGLGLS